MRRKTTLLIGIALTVFAFGLAPALPAAAKNAASTAPTPQPAEPLPARSRQALGAHVTGGAPVAQPKTGLSCSPAFSTVPSGNVTTNQELDAISANSPTDMWAVGWSNSGGTNVPDQNLAQHWNGTSWSVVGTPNVGNGFNDLNGVAAIDANNAWAVGNSQNGGILNTLAMHWNGSSWGVVATPQPSGSLSILANVSAIAANDAWAVGWYINGSGIYQTLTVHWDGASWTMVASANAPSGNNLLGSVFMLASNDVWAVGYYRAGMGTPRLTLIEHWNGSAWSIQSSPSPVTGDNSLVSVSATSATDVWAAGYTKNTATTPLQQTLTEHLVSGTWTVVASPNVASADNQLFGLVAISATNAWVVGYGSATVTSPFQTLTEHWDGSAWTIQTSASPGVNGNVLIGIGALPSNDVLATGGQLDGLNHETTLVTQFQLPPPTAVSAVAGDVSAMVSWTAPAFDCGFTTTSFLVTAWDGCVAQMSMSFASSPGTFTGLTNGSPVMFTVQAVSASLGAETPSAPSTAVVPAGATVPVALTACSTKQYQYASPDPTTFVDMDATNLKLSVTPTANSYAVISANVDLWTANAGLNQDVGINVSGGTFGSGQVVGWKESGGFAGTFSPNAAAVQSVVTLAGGSIYTVKLQWKSNKSFPGGLMVAGAGPLPGGGTGYSPTRLSMNLVPVALATVVTVSTTKQYTLANSDGATWVDMDATGLKASVPVTSDSTAVITGNADLWTANAGFNQDIALNVDGVISAWKESGGFAGTFSPNAAFVQAVVPLTVAGSPHTVKLQWKTNKPASGATIVAGAGPWPSALTFSPTRITVILLPAASVNSAVRTTQYNLPSSDGAGWTPIDSTNLKLSVSPVPGNNSYLVTGNADLWTANAGFNQDIGLFISGGVYGSGTLVAWKESGGFAGTFSPNAAYLESVQHLQVGTYTIWLAWKTNRQGSGSTIFAAAGPLPATTSFSPTRVTAVLLSSP